jgi:hypothetical protein
MATKAEFRRASARLLGPYQQGTATAGSSTSALVDATWPMMTSAAVDDIYTDQFIYRPDAALATDRVRLVNGYTPSTGTLDPDLAWTNAPSVGEVYELHGIIEPHTVLTQLVNDALMTLVLVNDELTFTPSPDVRRHSLAAVTPWLADRGWVRQVGWLDQHDDRNQIDPFETRPLRGEVQEDGGSYYLWTQHEFTGTETIYLRVLKPAYYHCLPSGGEPGDQDGLVLDDDECPADANLVAAAVRVLAWDKLNNLLAAGNADLAKRERAEAAQALNFWIKRFFKPYELTFQPLPAWGPGQAGVSR